jgi:hypothetical protein
MTTNVKGKTKATAAKGKTKATGLKEFLSNLATDPRKLGEFLHAPEDAMSAANLSEADKTALRSGVAGMVAARLAGVPLDQAFQPPPQVVSHFPVYYQKVAPEIAYMKQPPPQFAVYYQKVAAEPAYPPPQFPVYYQKVAAEPAYPPPQFAVYPPPQYVVYPPPQYVVYPPPQYVVYPPPQYVVYPPYYPR